MKPTALLMFSALAFSAASQAAPITVLNHSFEVATAQPAPNHFLVGFAPVDWEAYNPFGMPIGTNESSLGLLNPTGSGSFPLPPNGLGYFPGGAPDGNNVALTWLNDGEGFGNHNPLGISQTLGVGLTPFTRYTLNVEVGDIDSGITDGTPFNIEGFPGYAVQLLAGGVVLAEDNNSLGAGLTEGTFVTSTVEFITGDTVVAGLLQIRLINLNLPGTPAAPGIEVDFDNVRLNATAVPLPATIWLFGSALAGLVGIRRRR